jgi:hypothetical protein
MFRSAYEVPPAGNCPAEPTRASVGSPQSIALQCTMQASTSASRHVTVLNDHGSMYDRTAFPSDKRR